MDDDADDEIPHTALCIQPREGRLWIFLPPITHLEQWTELLGALELTARECKLAIDLEGYEPPADPRLNKLAVTPDPGVIEVNIHPAASWPEYVQDEFDAFLACGILAHGFLRLRCDHCQHEKLVAF